MKIRIKDLNQYHRSGSWTQDQIEALGEPFPQTKSWMSRVITRGISDAQWAAFVAVSTARPLGRKRKQQQVKREWHMAARRLGIALNVNKTQIAQAIRVRHQDAPVGCSNSELFAWFIKLWGSAPLPPKIARKRRSPYDLREGDDFLQSPAWRRVRMHVIVTRGARCECCGAQPSDGRTVINVDHIKPRRLHPELALTEANLQVLCHVCNHGKGNWDQTDWRPQPVAPRDAMQPRLMKVVNG